MTAAPGFTSQELRDDRQQIERHRAVDDRINLALIQGDLSRLSEKEKRDYYLATCKSLGLNPLTKPFEYLKLNGREILYARKDCTEQLRKLQRISLTILSRDVAEGIYVVTARAVMPGTAMMGGAYGDRTDEDIGAVVIKGLQGEPLANAMMKATTKAKRRVTLSICGLGMLDETEVEDIPGAQRVDHETGEITQAPPKRDTAPAPPPETTKAWPEATPASEELYRKRALEIAAAPDLKGLQRVWAAVSKDRTALRLSLEQNNRLFEAKDKRKAELSAPTAKPADPLASFIDQRPRDRGPRRDPVDYTDGPPPPELDVPPDDAQEPAP